MDRNYQKRHKLNSEGKRFTKNKASTTSHNMEFCCSTDYNAVNNYSTVLLTKSNRTNTAPHLRATFQCIKDIPNCRIPSESKMHVTVNIHNTRLWLNAVWRCLRRWSMKSWIIWCLSLHPTHKSDTTSNPSRPAFLYCELVAELRPRFCS